MLPVHWGQAAAARAALTLGATTAVQGLAVPKLPVESSTPSPGTHTLGKANILVRRSSQKTMC